MPYKIIGDHTHRASQNTYRYHCSLWRKTRSKGKHKTTPIPARI